ncbi:unnamed protein product [Candidula unifasciata]|uniref:G-protein coupled receptors family 1 profile domain-containing protein n=1 Tax=Candidula unifasciata TaxID=100452 RepID=A0A8S3ZRV9_9EUPU|nr:unnamed protein product [Candidula unifasciata]
MTSILVFDTPYVPINLSVPAWLISALNYSNTAHPSQVNDSQVTEVFKAAIDALNSYAVPVICVLGIIGDITSFLVFVCTSFRYQPCSQYLAALTFVDTLFLFSQLISSMMTFFPALALAPGYCNVMVYMSYVCSFLSAWYVVFMMIERYIAVCHPFRTSAISNKKKSIVLVAAMMVLSLMLYSHSVFTTSKSTQGNPCEVSRDYYDFISIFTYVDAILVFVIPFLAIVCLNLRIIFTVRKFRLQHNRLNHSIRRLQRYHNADKTLSLAQVRSTKMLVWVSSIFILLHLPSYVARLYGLVLQKLQGGNISESSRFRFMVAQHICQFLYYLNFAIDFIVYVMSSNNFRRNVSRSVKNIRQCKFQCHCEYK